MDIVCGVDFGEASRQAARGAFALASRSGGKVHLVHALQLPAIAWMGGEVMFLPPPQMDALRKQGDQALVELARSISDSTRIIANLEIGTPAETVSNVVARTYASLVCVGSHGHAAPVRWVLGSTAERVIASSSTPVLVFRGSADALVEWGSSKRVLRVLVTDDFGDGFTAAVGQLARLTGWADVEVHVAHVCEAPFVNMRSDFIPMPPRLEVEANIRVELRRRAEAAGLTCKADALHVLWGSPAATIASFAREGRFDLVVTGTHARRGFDRALLGSVAVGVLRRSPVPVLVVPIPPDAAKEAS